MVDWLVGELEAGGLQPSLLSSQQKEFILWGFWFPTGSWQEMSFAREEVIETVRDYKTSKHRGGCWPLKQARVSAVADIMWEHVNN